MFLERTSVGLDVHARSVAAAAIDGVTGEVFRARLVPSPAVVIGWIGSLPAPVAAVTSGPTGFGLYRALTGAGIRCQVAASSKLTRPSGDRVKTDARDALLLARLLRLDEVVAVSVPSREQEAARDLVRAREAARADLMRARHRLSKLLLRHGIVYSGGKAWTGAHDRWLLRQSFLLAGTQAAFEDAYEAQVLAVGRRDRLDEKIATLALDSQFTPVVRRLSCLRGISTLTAFGLAVEIGDGPGSPGPASAPTSGWSRRSTPRAPRGPRDRSPRPVTGTCAGCWSRRRGTTASPTVPRRCCDAGGNRRRRRPGPVAMPGTGGCMRAGPATPSGRSVLSSPTSPSPGSWQAGAGRSPCCRTDPRGGAVSNHRRTGRHGASDPARPVSGLTRRRQGRSSSPGPGPLPRPGPGLRALHRDPSSPGPWLQRPGTPWLNRATGPPSRPPVTRRDPALPS